jgi:hypothetical protein
MMGKQFGEPPLVDMQGGTLAVWLDPLGMLFA